MIVVDAQTWKILQQIDDVGPDAQTLAVTCDGKYGFAPLSGFPSAGSRDLLADPLLLTFRRRTPVSAGPAVFLSVCHFARWQGSFAPTHLPQPLDSFGLVPGNE